MRTIEITENDAGQRLDKFLSKRFKAMPPSLLYKYLRIKKIKLNGKKASPDTMLSKSDVLTLYISEEFFGESDEKRAFLRITPKVDIIYEDDNILIADKPAGLICHSDENESFNTLINHIKAYLASSGEYDVEAGEAFAPALCNRIDRNTCGLVIAAKNAAALRSINEKIKRREISKIYLAVVHGVPQKSTGTIRSFLQKDAESNKVFLKSKRSSADTKEAITKYKVLTSQNDLSLVEVELITGRTHQIRAQMASIGHPLLGDGKYAVNKDDRRLGFSYQALCSYRLSFEKGEGVESDALDYLNGKSFQANEPEFLKLFKKRRI